jgi:hypothetical protein
MNFRFGTVEMFDSHFNLVKTFTDPRVPAGFPPLAIHNIGRNLFVTFAEQDAAKHDDVARAGHEFVEVFNPNGDFAGQLRDTSHDPITLSGLSGLRFPTGSLNVPANTLYFTAGINADLGP